MANNKPDNQDILLSVLALDSYMRGTFAGIDNLPDQIGMAISESPSLAKSNKALVVQLF